MLRCYHNCICIFTDVLNKYRLIHGHFHIGLVIPRPPYWPETESRDDNQANMEIPSPPYRPETESRANMCRGMITRPIWKCPCIKLFITYF